MEDPVLKIFIACSPMSMLPRKVIVLLHQDDDGTELPSEDSSYLSDCSTQAFPPVQAEDLPVPVMTSILQVIPASHWPILLILASDWSMFPLIASHWWILDTGSVLASYWSVILALFRITQSGGLWYPRHGASLGDGGNTRALLSERERNKIFIFNKTVIRLIWTHMRFFGFCKRTSGRDHSSFSQSVSNGFQQILWRFGRQLMAAQDICRNWTIRRIMPRMVSTWVILACQKVKYTVRYWGPIRC